MQRRQFLNLTTLGLAFLSLPFSLLAAVWNKRAFDAEKLADAESGLALGQTTASDKIKIIAPERAENGAIVQVEIESQIANTEAIAIFVEKNPTALIGNFVLSPSVAGRLVTRIKMAETSSIKVVVKAENRYFFAEKTVQVMENGCGGGGANEKFEPNIKLRAKLKNGMTEVKAIMLHPMHTGRGKDDFNQLVPAHFIQLVEISLNGVVISQMQWGTGVAKNPYLTFYLNDAKLGDVLRLNWQDNQGLSASGETKVIAG